MGKPISSNDASRQAYMSLPQFQYALWQAQEKNAPVQFRYNDYQVTMKPDGTWTGEDKYGHFVRNSLLMLGGVLGGGAAAGAALGGGAAGGVAGGASGASGAGGAGGFLASTPLGTGYTAGLATAPAAVSGLSAAELAGLAGAGTGTGATAAAGAAGGIGSKVGNWLKDNAGDLVKGGAALGLTALANNKNTNASQMSPEQAETLRQLNEIIAEQKRRMQRQAGLSDATTDMAMGLLPTKYQR